MTVSITNGTRTVKAGDKLQLTLARRWYQNNGVFMEVWNRMPATQYVYTASAPPTGNNKTAIIDLSVSRVGAGKTLGQIADDVNEHAASWWGFFGPGSGGPDIVGLVPIALSDMRPSVAPSRRASAEEEAARTIAAAHPLNKLLGGLGFLGRTVAIVAVAAAIIYAVYVFRSKRGR